MKILWICVLLAFYAYAEELDYDDYYYGSLEELDKLISEDEKPTNEKTDIENDLKVEEEIQQFRKADENSDAVDDPKDTIDAIDDYQFEDNRDKSKEIVDDKDNTNNSDKLESNNELEHSAQENDNVENRPEDHNQNADYALLWGDDNIAPLPVPDEINNDDNEAILEETKNILEEEDADKFEDEIKDQFGNLDINEETRKLLEEEDADKFEDDIKAQIGEKDSKENKDDRETLKDFNNMLFGDDGINDNSEVKDLNANNDDSKLQGVGQEAIDNKYASEEDTVDKAYADLNADLDKLFETLDKLKDDGSDDKAIEEMEKQVDALFDSWEGDDLDENNMDGSDEFDDNPVDLDKLFSDILDDDDIKAEDVAADDMDLINDEVNEPNPDDAFEKDAETFDTDMGRIIFGEDALVDTEQKDKDTEQNIENIENDKNNGFTAKAEDVTPRPEEKEVKTALVDELNSAELDDLVSQFSILHSEDLDVHADSFDKNIAPIHITLKLDEPTLITSPGYPSPYPTNNIVDWILSGDGVGIELNITDFAVNGALGDYLLIKPGGVDESGHEGLLFTYRLTTERRYRFIDVDRVFMRFESKLGMMFNRGFSISAKMIAPLSERSEPVPEPEPVLSPPHSTSTVHLATTVLKFQDLKEQFTALLADMADRYIQDYDVEPGLNSTSEVTKITSVHLCPVSWPNFEHCVAVTFGISLEYDDEDQSPRLNEQDLEDMWTKYIHEEPFVTRLAEMGLSEFDQPAAGVMTAWLALGAGVALATVALAFVLWRCSCLQDYTRMQSYPEDASEAGSKRALDLYPTPHQTLPPLYCESEYKWDGHTTVDMGGFANRSYATDNMYDFESDEDVGPNRDRKGAQNSRDVCNV